jgi:hypothetical protein
MYMERRIQAAIYGEPHRDFSAIIGWKALGKLAHRASLSLMSPVNFGSMLIEHRGFCGFIWA